jgi:arylsulfatase A-like enzyme
VPAPAGASAGSAAGQGRTLDAPISLTQVAPTVCRALGIEPPLQADGAAVPGLLDLSGL